MLRIRRNCRLSDLFCTSFDSCASLLKRARAGDSSARHTASEVSRVSVRGSVMPTVLKVRPNASCSALRAAFSALPRAASSLPEPSGRRGAGDTHPCHCHRLQDERSAAKSLVPAAVGPQCRGTTPTDRGREPKSFKKSRQIDFKKPFESICRLSGGNSESRRLLCLALLPASRELQARAVRSPSSTNLVVNHVDGAPLPNS